jgi:GTP-binding protein Era
MTKPQYRAGHVAIIGRPNVGKSTLLNALIGQKISITSRKPQTTRQRVTGILTRPDGQLVFVDTPGFQTEHQSALNRAMNRSVAASLAEVDLVLWVIEGMRFDKRDAALLALLPAAVPVVLVINKIDRVADKRQLLPFVQEVSQRFPFAEIVPVSAGRRRHLDELLNAIVPLLPQSDPLFGEDEVTTANERFFAAEFIREQLFRLLGEELPYGLAVEIERFEEEGSLRRIHAAILVDRDSQKAIVIGRKGEKLKQIATLAREQMERLFGGKVFLEVWVKVKSGWADDAAALKRLGYDS